MVPIQTPCVPGMLGSSPKCGSRPDNCTHCRIEDLEKEHTQLNGERQRLQEDLEEVQERLTAGALTFCILIIDCAP